LDETINADHIVKGDGIKWFRQFSCSTKTSCSTASGHSGCWS
jgi:hypothetical protein